MDEQRYREIIMTRVTVPVGEDIGFLPGTEEEKMAPWMGALMDNLEVLTQNGRSEEHTSELQSLMRMSYAVFCLKQNNTYAHVHAPKRTATIMSTYFRNPPPLRSFTTKSHIAPTQPVVTRN